MAIASRDLTVTPLKNSEINTILAYLVAQASGTAVNLVTGIGTIAPAFFVGLQSYLANRPATSAELSRAVGYPSPVLADQYGAVVGTDSSAHEDPEEPISGFKIYGTNGNTGTFTAGDAITQVATGATAVVSATNANVTPLVVTTLVGAPNQYSVWSDTTSAGATFTPVSVPVE